MELYTLDALLRRTEVIDRFESLIWTERYSAYGDFELVIPSTLDSRTLLVPDVMLAMNLSDRIMVVETVSNDTDADGRDMLTIKGSDLVKILIDRMIKATMDNLTLDPAWGIEGLVMTTVRFVVDQICRVGSLSARDIVPFLQEGALYITPSIPEYSVPVYVEISPGSLYEFVKTAAETFEFGFRMVRNGDESEIYFEAYTGDDRTTLQEVFPPVVFSPGLDNLTGISEYTSTDGYKNVAHVFAPNGVQTVYAVGADADTAGFKRHVMYVDASDITLAAGPDLVTALKQRGMEALAKQRPLVAFDGEVPKNSGYLYNRDYFLGDLVEMQNSDGVTNNMKVTEHIFIDDVQGEQSYPTLAIYLLITPGSWYAWDSAEEWNDADGTWAEA